MNKIPAVLVAFSLASLLSSFGWAQTAAAPPDLASYDWSVKAAHSLATNPPPADGVWAFVNNALAGDPSQGHLCEFHFADLRHSGNLSLVVVIDSGGIGGCKGIDIFDKTAYGFEHYSSNANPEDNLRDSFQDVNHDGNFEFVLYGPLAPSARQRLACDAEWPMIFAWTGTAYNEVSSQYKGYYERYLTSLKKKIATSSADAEEAQAPVAGQALEPKPATMVPAAGAVIVQQGLSSSSNTNSTGPFIVPVPAGSSLAAATPVSTPYLDYDCLRMEAAKTEAFLGVHSDATMSYAVKASESNDPDRRVLAAVILSYIGTPEAMADLKELAADSDPAVADFAKTRLSYGMDPGEYYRQVSVEPVVFHPPVGKAASPPSVSSR